MQRSISFNGSIRPDLAVPLALGILGGSTIGTRIMQILPSKAHSSDLYPDPTLLRVTDDS